jgi:chromosome segregation ATPase
MKSLIMVTLAVVWLANAGFARAEFYRYVDRHGNIIFTDDLSKVPPDQRDKVQAYEESHSTESTVSPEAIEAAADNSGTQIETERQHLQKREKSLHQEYENLMTERAQLDEQKAEAVTSDQIRDYNEKIVQFNTRIQAYEEQRDAYDADLKTFNTRLEDLQAEAQKKQ